MQSLNTVGTISYLLHLIVAIGAVIPGGQFGAVLLIAALVLEALLVLLMLMLMMGC